MLSLWFYNPCQSWHPYQDAQAALERPAELVTHVVTLWSSKGGGWHLVLIAILMSMDPCHVYGPQCVIDLKKLEGWDGWHGSGMMNTKRNAKGLLHHNSLFLSKCM